MPFFRYQAQDASGKPLSGTLHAGTEAEARQNLSAHGLRVHSIHLATSAAPATTPAPAPVAAPAAPAPRVILTGRAAESPSQVRINAPPAKAAMPTVKTRHGSEKHLHFLFAQLASFARAGVTPQAALNDLANRVNHRDYAASLREAASRTVEGSALSDTLARYPYLYPPHVVGMAKAGEVGGFIPDAYDSIADWARRSRAFRRTLSYFTWISWMLLLMTPLVLAVVQGSLASMRHTDATGGAQPAGPFLRQAIGQEVLRMLPWMLVGVVVILVVREIWRSMPLRGLRHGLVYGLPMLGHRARSEGLTRFSWVLANLSRAGIAPKTATELAATVIPNVVMQERMQSVVQASPIDAKTSEMIGRAGLVPREYSDIVQTGEVSGDVPGALAYIAEATSAEFESRDKGAKWVARLVLYPAIAVVVLVIVYQLYMVLYPGIQDVILGDV